MTGQVLGHYRLLEKIGSGGMGDVFRAHDGRLERDVAVKVLKAAAAADPDRLRRFEQEARAAAVLNHPNIVAVYDIGIHEGAPYIVSELLEGQTLRQRLTSGPLQVRIVTEYARQLAEGLMAAHERRIIHRDLKPENVLITRDGHVKILDFGIAKLNPRETSDKPPASAQDPTQTKVGIVLGTVGYMSPEQLRGKLLDHRTDIFSFGAILYEMLTGNRAFVGETEVDTMLAVLNSEPPEISLVRQNVPDAFDQIVRHCLEKEPENRFQSARDLSFALSTVTASSSKQVAIPDPRWKRIRRQWPWIAAASALISAAVFLGTLLRHPGNVEYRRITFERGTVYSARFRPDGRSILYSAAWNGRPAEIYSTVGDSPQAQPVGLTGYLLGISRNNELALVLRATHGARLGLVGGVLSRAPLAGGTPREMVESVRWADWGPNGELAVVRRVQSLDRLEFPIGKVLYETHGDITHIRFSPKGDRIAFMDHAVAWDDRGSLSVIDLQGKRTNLTRVWQSEDGLAWSPNGKEIWFTAAESSISNRELWAVDLSGKLRRVVSGPGGFTLQDIAADGRVLVTLSTERLAMEWVGPDQKRIQDLSWYDWTIAKDISPDGQWVLFEEGGAPAGSNYAVAIRKIDGSPPIRLGDGTAGGLSPDGKWAISVSTSNPPHLTLLPIGAGETREIPLPGLNYIDAGAARFMPDGRRIIVAGSEPGHSLRSYLVDVDGSQPPRPAVDGEFVAGIPSPDGRYLAGAGAIQSDSRKITLFPVDGGASIPLPATYPPYIICQWSADSRSVFVYPEGELPLTVSRVDIASGKISPLRQLTPADRAGVVSIGPVVCKPSGDEFAFSFYQTLSVTYVISGLK